MKQTETGAGVIDSGYRRIISLALQNPFDKAVTFNVGDKIAQLLFEKISLPILVEVVDFDDTTGRDPFGFGSTSI